MNSGSSAGAASLNAHSTNCTGLSEYCLEVVFSSLVRFWQCGQVVSIKAKATTFPLYWLRLMGAAFKRTIESGGEGWPISISAKDVEANETKSAVKGIKRIEDTIL